MISLPKPMLCSRAQWKNNGNQSRCRKHESKTDGILENVQMTHFFVPKSVSNGRFLGGFTPDSPRRFLTCRLQLPTSLFPTTIIFQLSKRSTSLNFPLCNFHVNADVNFNFNFRVQFQLRLWSQSSLELTSQSNLNLSILKLSQVELS